MDIRIQMVKRWHRLSALGLLSLLVLPVCGLFLWMHLHKLEVRHEIKEGYMAAMDRALLTELTFHLDEVNELLDWEHESEFNYQGEMYDVVSRSTGNDSITFWCWKDDVETEMDHTLSLLTDQWLSAHPEQQAHNERVVTFLQELYHNLPFELVSHQHPEMPLEWAEKLWSIRKEATPPASPPPDFALLTS